MVKKYNVSKSNRKLFIFVSLLIIYEDPMTLYCPDKRNTSEEVNEVDHPYIYKRNEPL